MAVDAERPQPVGRRHQDEPADPLGLVGWSLVGTVETGFNPYSWNLADAQRSQVQNNGKALTLQGANADSGRTGQWDNSQGFIGFSNKTYGTLVGGRVNTLSLDGLDLLRSDGQRLRLLAVRLFRLLRRLRRHRDDAFQHGDQVPRGIPMNFTRLAASFRSAAYNQGNASTSMYQGQASAPTSQSFAGNPMPPATSRCDFIGAYAQNAVNVSTFTGTCAVTKSGPDKGQTACTSGIPQYYNQSDVKATLSNNTGVFLLGKYKFAQFPLTLSGGWE